jgi:ligand-binding SRPBCC domain-containing protein
VANLAGAMPNWLSLDVLTPQPVAMAVGTRIRYRLRIYGVPVTWQSRFTRWEPPHRFAYQQERGPFRSWHHEHEFASSPGGGTVMTDRCRYQVPIGWPVQRIIVGPLLDRLFASRARVLSSV